MEALRELKFSSAGEIVRFAAANRIKIVSITQGGDGLFTLFYKEILN